MLAWHISGALLREPAVQWKGAADDGPDSNGMDTQEDAYTEWFEASLSPAGQPVADELVSRVSPLHSYTGNHADLSHIGQYSNTRHHGVITQSAEARDSWTGFFLVLFPGECRESESGMRRRAESGKPGAMVRMWQVTRPDIVVGSYASDETRSASFMVLRGAPLFVGERLHPAPPYRT